MDDLRELTVEQEIDLLNKNNIYLSTKQVSLNDQSGFGAMDADVVTDIGLQPASGFTPAVRFRKVKVQGSQRGLNQNTAYSYNEFEFIFNDNWRPKALSRSASPKYSRSIQNLTMHHRPPRMHVISKYTFRRTSGSRGRRSFST